MAPKFGTSGLRGLVSDLTPGVVRTHVTSFATTCATGRGLFVGRDLRPSSPRIAADVIAAARSAGLSVTDCGVLPTPALAYAAMEAGAGAVMVTGSHIPADRNGLKFYRPTGEISKEDEAAILAACSSQAATPFHVMGARHAMPDAARRYLARYRSAFGPRSLAGLRLGIYQHSSVARDLLVELVTELGASAVPLARSDIFVAIDTEAVAPSTQQQLETWCSAYGLDALLSTDGDADRPMLADGAGKLVPGDILGVLTAQALCAEVVCTPVSTNSMMEEIADFRVIHRTRIGSPHVIAAMKSVLTEAPEAKVVGFEANGGFLLGFHAQGDIGPLSALMTRDAILPMLAPLAATHAAQQSLRERVAALPARFTASNRLVEVSAETCATLLSRLETSRTARAEFLAPLGREASVDSRDGLRIRLQSGRIVHLRPSGNAPELRIYVEAEAETITAALLDAAMRQVTAYLSQR